MSHQATDFDRWYIRLLASVFAIGCGISTVRYLWMDITGDGYVPLATQLFCFALTAASIVFFVRPTLGHRLLLYLALMLLLYYGPPTGSVEANLFWLSVVALLCLPWLFRRRKFVAA